MGRLVRATEALPPSSWETYEARNFGAGFLIRDDHTRDLSSDAAAAKALALAILQRQREVGS